MQHLDLRESVRSNLNRNYFREGLGPWQEDLLFPLRRPSSLCVHWLVRPYESEWPRVTVVPGVRDEVCKQLDAE